VVTSVVTKKHNGQNLQLAYRMHEQQHGLHHTETQLHAAAQESMFLLIRSANELQVLPPAVLLGPTTEATTVSARHCLWTHSYAPTTEEAVVHRSFLATTLEATAALLSVR
jgi:hypothetical protein